MQIIDTHCHLIDEDFANEVDIIINRAIDANVSKMVVACCDEKEILPIANLCAKYPGVLYPTVGIHPENMADDIEAQLQTTKSMLDELMQDRNNPQNNIPEICAIGEIGLDLHWDKSRFKDQVKVLTEQIKWALEYDLPLLLHIRDAMPEFLQLLNDTLFIYTRANGKPLRGILHCYSGTAQEATEAQLYGDFLIGVGGTVTYKKSLVPAIVEAVGLDRIVLETDAPYLAPMPNRGKRNEPSYTALTCQWIADFLKKPVEEVASITTSNATKMLNLQ